jgi:7,8-dihydroneopterin aldolase/epimerase/oxygenase
VKLHPRIGVALEERSNPQECEADLTIWGDFEAAATTDSIDKSIDYCRVLEEMHNIAGERDYVLIETLVYRIARSILEKFPINRVKISLRKRPASLHNQIDFVEIEVEEE